jgi:hypothetical protein
MFYFLMANGLSMCTDFLKPSDCSILYFSSCMGAGTSFLKSPRNLKKYIFHSQGDLAVMLPNKKIHYTRRVDGNLRISQT